MQYSNRILDVSTGLVHFLIFNKSKLAKYYFTFGKGISSGQPFCSSMCKVSLVLDTLDMCTVSLVLDTLDMYDPYPLQESADLVLVLVR